MQLELDLCRGIPMLYLSKSFIINLQADPTSGTSRWRHAYICEVCSKIEILYMKVSERNKRACHLPPSFLNNNRPLGSSLLRDGLGLTLKPLPRQLILVEVVVRLVPDLRVVIVHPLELGIVQQRGLDKVAANGSHGNVLEAEPLLVAKLVGGLDLTGHDDVCKRVNWCTSTRARKQDSLSMRIPNLPSS